MRLTVLTLMVACSSEAPAPLEPPLGTPDTGDAVGACDGGAALDAAGTFDGGLTGSDGLPALAFWPQGGLVTQDISLPNAVDLDRRDGAVETYRCDGFVVDGHTGTDGVIRSFLEMEIGVPIFAVLDGIVVSEDDQWYDECYAGNPNQVNREQNGEPVCTVQTSNHVHIETGDILLRYRHNKQGSTAPGIRVGSCVKAGEQIALTGSSGASKRPHIHFGVALRGESGIDPFIGPCNPNPSVRWASDPPAPAPEGCRLAALGVSAHELTGTGRFLPFLRPEGGPIPENAQQVYVWGFFNPQGLAGQAELEFTLRDEGGRTAGPPEFWPQTVPLTAAEPPPFYKQLEIPPSSLPAGPWVLEVAASYPGCSFRQEVPVTVSSSPEANSLPAQPDSVAISAAHDPPMPTDALRCEVRLPPYPDAEHDVIRYHYVWQDVTDPEQPSTIRETIHAGQADAISRQPPGRTILCSVRVGDGKGWNPPAYAEAVIAPGRHPDCGE